MIDTIFNYDDLGKRPLVTYLYRVSFYSEGDSVEELNKLVQNIESIDLPKAEFQTIVEHFMSTKKVYRIKTNLDGDITIKSTMRNNDFTNSISNLSQLDVTAKKAKYMVDSAFDTIYIDVLNSNNKSESGYDIAKRFRLFNCVLTNIEFDTLSYSSENAISVSIGVHYSSWD